VATRLLANEGAGDLAILGCGLQGRKHLEAVLTVRFVHRVRAWDPIPGVAEAFAKRESERHGLEIEYQDGGKADITGADIICTVTPSPEPVLFGRDISPGTHINAVGACTPHARELDSEVLSKSRLFVDRKEATLCEAGDFLIPKGEGILDDAHIVGEIGQILIHELAGRRSPEEITLFESLGLAVEDLAAAHFVYKKAQQEGMGTSVVL
jgi:ornithine cyclodeaminase